MTRSSLSHYENPCPWLGAQSDVAHLLDGVVENAKHFWVYVSETEIQLFGIASYFDAYPLLATLAVECVGGQNIYNVRTPRHLGISCFTNLAHAKQWAEAAAQR